MISFTLTDLRILLRGWVPVVIILFKSLNSGINIPMASISKEDVMVHLLFYFAFILVLFSFLKVYIYIRQKEVMVDGPFQLLV